MTDGNIEEQGKIVDELMEIAGALESTNAIRGRQIRSLAFRLAKTRPSGPGEEPFLFSHRTEIAAELESLVLWTRHAGQPVMTPRVWVDGVCVAILAWRTARANRCKPAPEFVPRKPGDNDGQKA